jgi:hypothetical protein
MAGHQTGLIDSVAGAVWARHPLEPFTTSGKLPIGEPVVVVRVIVDELPVVLLGVKLALTWLGNPGALNVIGAVKPCSRLIDMDKDVLTPCTTAWELGVVDKEKSPTMFRVTDVVCVIPPFEAEKMIGKLPAHALPVVVMLAVAVLPHTTAGLKVTPVPVGCPAALKATHPVN